MLGTVGQNGRRAGKLKLSYTACWMPCADSSVAMNVDVLVVNFKSMSLV